MVRCGEGAAGLTCDGCRRAIRRGAGWWCCEMCDYDRGATRAARCRGSQTSEMNMR